MEVRRARRALEAGPPGLLAEEGLEEPREVGLLDGAHELGEELAQFLGVALGHDLEVGGVDLRWLGRARGLELEIDPALVGLRRPAHADVPPRGEGAQAVLRDVELDGADLAGAVGEGGAEVGLAVPRGGEACLADEERPVDGVAGLQIADGLRCKRCHWSFPFPRAIRTPGVPQPRRRGDSSLCIPARQGRARHNTHRAVALTVTRSADTLAKQRGSSARRSESLNRGSEG